MSRSLNLQFSKSNRLFFHQNQYPAILSHSRKVSNIYPNNHQDVEEPCSDPLLRKLEDVIHRMIVRRSAPDWLPFLPGSSYWVPSRSSASSQQLAHLVEKLARPMPGKEFLSPSYSRGWPSDDYFVHETKLFDVESSMMFDNVEVVIVSTHVSDSEDEQV